MVEWLKNMDWALFVAFVSLLVGCVAIYYAKKTYNNAEEVYQFQLITIKREIAFRDMKLSLVNSYLQSQIIWYERYFNENIKCLIKIKEKLISGNVAFKINEIGEFHTITFNDSQLVLFKNIEFKVNDIFELINVYANKGISVSDKINGLAESSSRVKGFFDLTAKLMHINESDKTSVDVGSIIATIDGVIGDLNSITKRYINDINADLNRNT